MTTPAERAARGGALQTELTGAEQRAPTTLVEQSWRDFVYAEVWSRPGLTSRARFCIALAGAAGCGHGHAISAYARGALTSGALTLAELREAALHIAVYSGWSAGGQVDGALSKLAAELKLAEAPVDLAQDRSEGARAAAGDQGFFDTMGFSGPPPIKPFWREGIRDFVFAEMWTRPALDQVARRWLTLVGVCDSGMDIPIRSHIHAAMTSGNCSEAELDEFVLAYGIHAGWPRASYIQGVVSAMAKKAAAGVAYDG